MILLRKPSAETLHAFLASQTGLDLTYPGVGATASAAPPAGYAVDHTRVRLGAGQRVFESAKAALGRWDQFRLGWVEAWSPDDSIKVGGLVGVSGRSLGVWWLNACRIVYVVEEPGPMAKFGFAYGTLPGHVERGEERFLVEWDQADDGVWFDILAYSRPRHFLARVGRPWVRRIQKRFGRESAKSMIRAVENPARLDAS